MSERKEKVWSTVLTPLGAKVSVGAPPEHLGDGIMMLLTMQDPKDIRRAEVFLDRESLLDLIGKLQILADEG